MDQSNPNASRSLRCSEKPGVDLAADIEFFSLRQRPNHDRIEARISHSLCATASA